MNHWDDVRTVLRETAEMLNREEIGSTGSLEQRALQLARLPEETDSGIDALYVVIFTLGAERYAWSARSVRTIARTGHITPVPSAPAYYRGVTSLRGQILSVLDLHTYLNLPAAQEVPPFMILIEGAGLQVSVLADEVFDVSRLPASSFGVGTGMDVELITGVTKDGLILLDAEVLLRRERRRVEAEDAA